MVSVATTYLALLRGINVGGKNKLPMKDLVDMFVAVGCDDVRTYIQSGNVLFRTTDDASSRIPNQITTRIAERYGYRVPLVLRTAEQVRNVVENNPFLADSALEDALHVMFLADLPHPSRVDDLDPNRSVPDRFIVRGQEIYLRLPHGMADTKLSNAYFDAKLATTSTARNWRTVTKLLDLMEERS